MEEIMQRNLSDWKSRTEKEIEELEEVLKDVELGSDKDVILSTKLGKKRSLLDGINEEINRSKNRQENKISGEM